MRSMTRFGNIRAHMAASSMMEDKKVYASFVSNPNLPIATTVIPYSLIRHLYLID